MTIGPRYGTERVSINEFSVGHTIMMHSNGTKTWNWLMTTAAAIALGIASPALSGNVVYEAPTATEVTPAPSATDKFWLSAEGGMADIVTTFSNGVILSEDDYCDFLDECTTTGGMSLAFEAGMYIGNGPYSVSLGYRMSSEGVTFSGTAIGEISYPFDVTRKNTITTIDFEVGRDLSLGTINSRITLGVRHADLDFSYEFESDFENGNGGWGFAGIGPRVALEASVPVFDRVSIDAEAGAALLFGDSDSSRNHSLYGASEDSDPSTFTNLDFSAALSYLIGGSTKVSLGYRYEQFTSKDAPLVFGYGPDAGMRSNQGAFVKFSTSF